MDELSFYSHGVRCDAWLVPAGSDALLAASGRPCVVMAHGFGCTRDSGLLPIAQRFAAAGLDVLLFDYRGFGASDGQPRQVVSHRRHRQDYHAALAAARARAGVDPARVALWGTSYSGGHVLAVAARDRRVAAVVAQAAAVDGLAVLRKPERADPRAVRGKGPRMALAALRDCLHTATGRGPVMLRAVGAPREFAMLTDPHDYRDYLALMGPTWRNEVCARSLLSVPFNRPVTLANRIRCPALFVVTERDTVAPSSAVREAARRMGHRAEVVAFDCAHFGVYSGAYFEASVAVQTEFLARVLAPVRTSAGRP